MRLLLTRAAQDAARTREKLEAAGHRVIVSPVIEIAPTGQDWPAGVVDAVLATSGQAFAVMDNWTSPTPETRRLMPLFLVGERTAALARTHGFAGPATIAPNVSMLAVSIGKWAGPRRRVLYLAGRDRKPDIETALGIVGHCPDVVEVYAAEEVSALTPEAIEAVRVGSVGGVLHFSRRSAALFRALAAEAGLDIRPLRHFCLSDDVAAPLADAGSDAIEIAEAPTEAALLSRVGRA